MPDLGGRQDVIWPRHRRWAHRDLHLRRERLRGARVTYSNVVAFLRRYRAMVEKFCIVKPCVSADDWVAFGEDDGAGGWTVQGNTLTLVNGR